MKNLARIFIWLSSLFHDKDYFSSLDRKTKRISTCLSCRHFDDTLEACWICGCYVELKASINKEKCPDSVNRWELEPQQPTEQDYSYEY